MSIQINGKSPGWSGLNPGHPTCIEVRAKAIQKEWPSRWEEGQEAALWEEGVNLPDAGDEASRVRPAACLREATARSSPGTSILALSSGIEEAGNCMENIQERTGGNWKKNMYNS